MKIPYYKQETGYTCGGASMRMVLESLGIKKTEKALDKLLKTNKIRGTWRKNIIHLTEHFKLKSEVGNGTFKKLKTLQKQGYKIIICYYCLRAKVDHYTVLKKIDSDYIYFYDPWYGPEHKYKLNYFKRIWKTDPKYEHDKFWFIAMKK